MKLKQELAQARKENEVKQTKIDALMVKGIGDLFNEDDCREARQEGFLEAIEELEKYLLTNCHENDRYIIKPWLDKLAQMKKEKANP